VAQTPFQRLTASLGRQHRTIRKLNRHLKGLNPFALKQQLERQLKGVWREATPWRAGSARPADSLRQPSTVSLSCEATKPKKN
jgi:hypothetical protein